MWYGMSIWYGMSMWHGMSMRSGNIKIYIIHTYIHSQVDSDDLYYLDYIEL